MTKPYSEDLRTRVVAAVGAGGSCREAAKQFSIGVSSVVRWAQRFRRTGCVAAKPMGGERHSRLKDERDWLLARVAASPDLPLHEIRRELAARNVHVGYGTLWRFFAKETIPFKKRMARPAGKQFYRERQMISLLQRIRPRVKTLGQDGDTRAPVLIKLSASSAVF